MADQGENSEWKAIIICGALELFAALVLVIVGGLMIGRSEGEILEYRIIDNGGVHVGIAVVMLVTGVLAWISGAKKSQCYLIPTLILGIMIFLASVSTFSALVDACINFKSDAGDESQTVEERRRQHSDTHTLAAIAAAFLCFATIIVLIMDVFVLMIVIPSCRSSETPSNDLQLQDHSAPGTHNHHHHYGEHTNVQHVNTIGSQPGYLAPPNRQAVMGSPMGMEIE